METTERWIVNRGLRTVRRCLHTAAAVIVSMIVLGTLALGSGTVPALGSALSPGGGVWSSAADAKGITSKTVRLPGMGSRTTVSFDSAGVPAVRASSDADLYQAQGYLHATFRLTQLDLERRTAKGRLAEIQGPAGVKSDTFELQTGLLRTARSAWSAMPKDGPDAKALVAYSRGVNARLAELRESGDWPALFTLTGLYPQDWTPVDTLAVQSLVTQNLNYSISPLVYELLRQSLGKKRTMEFFPVIPANEQSPYDPGPYRDLGVSPLPATDNVNAAVPDGGAARTPTTHASSADVDSMNAPASSAAGTLLERMKQLPATSMFSYPDSNAWAANGPKTAGGTAMLAGDPHLATTLPSFWYQIALSAPGTEASGASLVGVPGILVGRNQSISWSLTNVQNQSTLFYSEKTSPARPNQYFWNGSWRDMEQERYTIPVRGGSPVRLTVDRTVHGPVMTRAGQTVSVTWMGNYPSRSLKAMLAMNKAQNFREFRAALADWHSPTLNFAYADGRGNIGVVAAGHFPVVKAGEPWFPLSGTGENDLVGTIPYAATPQAYNPPGHILATANQRPVGPSYPYYIGTSYNAYDTGYRANRIYQYLESHDRMTAADFTALQNDVEDYLARKIVPRLESALESASLDARQRRALDQLANWDYRMTESSTGATVWWTFWTNYLSAVFQPWWDAKKVPVDKAEEDLTVSPLIPSLNEDLEVWTLRDPDNAAFSPPGRPAGDADSAMRAAFTRTVSELGSELGDDPASWRWGRVHTREIAALSGASALSYGPKPAEGNHWTVNAAEGGMNSSFGPSWRMVVTWTGRNRATASAIYPGGQNENPASPWYETFIADWWAGRLRPMPLANASRSSGVVWTLQPKG
ncbi:penicillin acylase family protein [Streptomyces chartreusis]|uniref:penicillin acylase family protein n=1 Tax=Streptomyces chartreusis TaxID=1969 RepID=UPI00365F55E6